MSTSFLLISDTVWFTAIGLRHIVSSSHVSIYFVLICTDICKDKILNEENEKFDKILIDAPCSGLGVIRRNPDTKWRVLEKDLKKYKERQINMLENLAKYVKKLGTIVYAVCSAEPEETDEVATSFLKSHPEFKIEKIENELFRNTRFFGKNYLKTSPNIDDMDGFFCICFKKL